MEDIPKYNLQLLLFSLHRTFGVEKISTVRPEESVLYSESLSGKIFSGQIFAPGAYDALRGLSVLQIPTQKKPKGHGETSPPIHILKHLLE